MPRKFVDLSIPLETGVAYDPPFMLPEIDYFDHSMTAGQMADFFPGLQRGDLPGGDGWAIETLRVSSHNGTHLDAPYHHHSTMNGGERAITIDEVPLEWCFNPGVKLDFRRMPDGHVVNVSELEAEFQRIGHVLSPLEIVVINTSAGAFYGDPSYLNRGCGIGRDATLWLLERGVRVTGTDAWSWDAPFSYTAKRWEADHDPSIIWEGHRASIDIGYCHMEKLSKLELLPSSGFEIACFPVKLKNGSAGFTRAVAIFQD